MWDRCPGIFVIMFWGFNDVQQCQLHIYSMQVQQLNALELYHFFVVNIRVNWFAQFVWLTGATAILGVSLLEFSTWSKGLCIWVVTNKVVVMVWYMGQGEGEEEEDLGSHHTMAFKLKFFFSNFQSSNGHLLILNFWKVWNQQNTLIIFHATTCGKVKCFWKPLFCFDPQQKII